MLIPKEMREYNRLIAALAGKEIHDHYWTVLNDPEHEHHKEIIRYKWMDKVRWKHRPNDFFGYVKYTKESGEETKGSILPKVTISTGRLTSLREKMARFILTSLNIH